MSLSNSLGVLAQQTKKRDFKEKILKMSDYIEGGNNLSQAFSHFPDLFSPFYIGMLKSGEASGNVPETLEYLADYLEREQDFVSKALTALIYPAFLTLVFVIIAFIGSIFIIPTFEDVFKDMEIELPFITKVVIGFSNFIRGWWWFFLLCFVTLIVLFFYSLKQKQGKKILDKNILDLPLIGPFVSKFFLSRIALNLSTLISGGVPISQALEITADLVGNLTYKEIMVKTKEAVRAGKSISSVLSTYPDRFPPLFIQMISTGEKTGKLESSLLNIVKYYQKDVDKMLDVMVKFLEPVLIIFFGVLVGILALSLFLPLFQQGMNF
jgi:type IV pilus assembly protein PilC